VAELQNLLRAQQRLLEDNAQPRNATRRTSVAATHRALLRLRQRRS